MKVEIFLFLAILMKTQAENLKLLLLHNNDIHGRFEETSRNSGICKPEDADRNCYGGFARLANVIRNAREAAEKGEGPKVLFLNAGDTYTGTAWFALYKWKIVQDFLNRLQPDAICLGNHEFYYGLKGLIPFVEHFKFPIVAANLNFSKVPILRNKITPSVIINVDGYKVGIIGYVTTESKKVLGISEIDFHDEITSVKRESERLNAEGVKIIMALGHAGITIDKAIAKECPYIDVVIGRHTNTFLWNGDPPDVEVPKGPYPIKIVQASGKKVPVVQAFAHTKYLGRLYVTFDPNGNLIEFIGKPLLLNSEIPQDKDILDILNVYRKDLDALMKHVIATTRVDLDIADCRVAECNFGNLITDAFIESRIANYQGPYWTDAPIAVTIAASIRMSLDRGDLTEGHFLGALPFNLQVISFDLIGAHFLEMLETSVKRNGPKPEFLQVSGVRVTYDLSKPSGQRVVEVLLRCAACNVPKYERLDINKTYRVLGNSFVLIGFHLQRKAFNKHVEDLNDFGASVAYVQSRKVVYTEVEGRINFVKLEETSSTGYKASYMLRLLVVTLFILNCF